MKPLVVIVKKPQSIARALADSKAVTPLDRGDSLPKQKPNPLNVAQMWLGFRLTEKTMPDGSKSHFLDGRPTYLDAIMRETNRVLKANGFEQIGHSERWLV